MHVQSVTCSTDTTTAYATCMLKHITDAIEAATGLRPAITAVAEDTTTSSSSNGVLLSNQITPSAEALITDAGLQDTNSGNHSDVVPLEHMLYLFAQQRLAIVDAWQQKPHLQDRPLPMTEVAKENKRIRSSMQNHSNRQQHK
jgi:hypothetical protein